MFASGGIGDLSLKEAEVEVLVANELIGERAEIFKHNFPDCDMLTGDIWKLKDAIIDRTIEKLNGRRLDVLMATPPCQGMSKNGRGKLLNAIRSGIRPAFDTRNELIVPTLYIARALLPEIIVFENVPEMGDTLIPVENTVVNIIDYIRAELKPLGYVGHAEVIEFADYGVPQRRQRLITIFSRDEKMKAYFNTFFSFIPHATHSSSPKNGQKPWVTLRAVLADTLPLDAACKDTATSNIPFHAVPILDKKKYFWVSNTPPQMGAFDNQCVQCGYQQNPVHGAGRDESGINRANGHTPIRCVSCGELLPRPWVKQKGEYRLMKGFTSAYRRMKWDLPANALTTNLSYACSDSKLHPEQHRVLSLYEAFILHTVDLYPFQWYRADGKKVSEKLVREIIGESIPPKGLEYVLKYILSIYQGKARRYLPGNLQMRLFEEPEPTGYSLSEEL